MPNIEIYGFSNEGNVPEERPVFNLRKIIEKQIQLIGLENESVVTTVFGSIVRSCDGERTSMPFIRVCSTEAGDIRTIVKALKKAKIGLDVETLILNSFIPKDEMK